MLMFLLKALAFILVLGVIIVLHEMGHFFAGKWQGIKIAEFSVGFGKAIVQRTRNGIQYSWRILPLGGFVKFHGGELVLGRDEALLKEVREQGIDPDDPDLLVNRPASQRLLVFAAGPLMNIALAFLVAPLVFFIGIEEPRFLDEPAKVAWLDKDSPAEKAGIELGETITAINGQPTPTWKDVMEKVGLSPDQELKLAVSGVSGARNVTLRSIEDPTTPIGDIGIGPTAPPPAEIGQADPANPAYKAGLRPGDRITRINGEPVTDWFSMASAIRPHVEEAIQVEWLRPDGTAGSAEITTLRNPDGGTGMIGISPAATSSPMKLHRYGLVESIRRGFDRAYNDWLLLIFKTFQKLFTGQLSMRAMAGPIGIATIIGDQVESGIHIGDVLIALSMMLNLVGMLSMNIGILNLLPFPPLDGSHIAFLGIEKVRGRALAGIWMERIMKAGVAMVITLFLFITYNDVLRTWGGTLGRWLGR